MNGRVRREEPLEVPSNDLGTARFRVLLGFVAVLVVYEAVESLLWADRLWGAHFYAFFPRAVLFVSAGATLLAIGWAAFRGNRAPSPEAAEPAASRTRLLAALGAALLAGVVFWIARERHLFWGDGLPLSIDIPRGQKFHPDEPLTMYLHHLLFVLGGGRWSGATAVALGSTLSGMAFVGIAVWWLGGRVSNRWTWGLAAATLVFQGFAALFFGHVENYSYLAVAILVFMVSGIDFLEGHGNPFVPLGAAIVAYALHILGGLMVVPAAFLVWVGLRDPARRRVTAIAAVGAVVVLLFAGAGASVLYENRSPLDGLISGAARVFTNPRDMQASALGAARHWANVWSLHRLLGPLSILWLGWVFAVLWPGTRTAKGLFLLLGAVGLLLPSFVTGEGNLGAARNWDLFAAPSIVAPLAGLVLVLDRLDAARSRRLMVALLAASLFHTVPWIALNANLEGTIERIARLPLTDGRGEIMIGTYYLNRADLPQAERWFRRAVAKDFDNANGQSGLGLALARQGKLEEAVGPMIAATRLRPGVLTYEDDLITLFLALQRWDQAAAVLEDRLAIEPRNVDAWRMLASCRARSGDADAAIGVLEQGVRTLGQEPALLTALADSYEWAVVQEGRRGAWAKARSTLDRFESAFPRDERIARLRQNIP